MRWETRPALHTADAAAIQRAFSDEMVLARPPVPIQKIVFACLVPLARRAS